MALALAGCAGGRPPPDPVIGWYVPPSLPAASRGGRGCQPASRCGAAGEATAVRADPERDAVRTLVERYVSLLTTSTAEGMAPLFADVVGGVQNPSPPPLGASSRAMVLLRHERLVFPMTGGATLQRAVRVRSFAECAAERCAADAMRPGDWYADWSLPIGRSPNGRPVYGLGALVPQAVIVRWDPDADGPRIAGLTDGVIGRPLP